MEEIQAPQSGHDISFDERFQKRLEEYGIRFSKELDKDLVPKTNIMSCNEIPPQSNNNDEAFDNKYEKRKNIPTFEYQDNHQNLEKQRNENEKSNSERKLSLMESMGMQHEQNEINRMMKAQRYGEQLRRQIEENSKRRVPDDNARYYETCKDDLNAIYDHTLKKKVSNSINPSKKFTDITNNQDNAIKEHLDKSHQMNQHNEISQNSAQQEKNDTSSNSMKHCFASTYTSFLSQPGQATPPSEDEKRRKQRLYARQLKEQISSNSL